MNRQQSIAGSAAAPQRCHARTVDHGSAEPSRACVFIGANDSDLLPVGAEPAHGGVAGLSTPSDLLCAALAASYDSAIRLAAARRGVAVESLTVEASGWAHAAGGPAGFHALHCHVRLVVAPGTDGALVRSALAEAEGASIVFATLRRAVPIHTTVQHDVQPALALAA